MNSGSGRAGHSAAVELLAGSASFAWSNDGRLIRFGWGARRELADLLDARGFREVVFVTGRSAVNASWLESTGRPIVRVGIGLVEELAGKLLEQLRGNDLVAVGGGRVIDCAKAVAAVTGGRCAAVPTTLSGAELTGFHRLPRGYEGARTVRPELVVWDPELLASAPPRLLAESAGNALAHALEALYTRLATPVATAAALLATETLACGLEGLAALRAPAAGEPTSVPGADQDPERGLYTTLASGGLLAGWASGEAGIAFHHALCQTLVRVLGSSHAATNAAVLPASAGRAARYAPTAVDAWLAALARGSAVLRGEEDAAAMPRAQALSRLRELLAAAGARPPRELLALARQRPLSERVAQRLRQIAARVQAHPATTATAFPVSEEDVVATIRDAADLWLAYADPADAAGDPEDAANSAHAAASPADAAADSGTSPPNDR